MANYTKTTNFLIKDSYASGNPDKVIKGSEIDAEYTNISTAIASKADRESPTFTGTPTYSGPPIAAGTNTAQLATTAFVTSVYPSQANSYTGVQTFRNTTFEIVDATDITKKATFTASGITTGTTRAFIFPDKSGTLAVTSDLAGVSPLSTTTNTIVSGSYSVSGNSTISFSATNGFSAGQEVNIDFTMSTGSTLVDGKYTIVSADGSSFTINYGSTVTSSGTFSAERYGIIAVANAAEMTAGTSQVKAVTPKLYADSTLGVGQTWQLPTRVIGTSYQNTTGRPIQVCFSFNPNSGAGSTTVLGEVSTDGTTWISIIRARNSVDQDINGGNVSFIVPNNLYYRITRSGNNIDTSIWAELR